ncbi:hypothetical protein BB381_04810 [Campylobacter pinnipediorum subsp. caledonicus]|uniref:hypothetical protein n=1 Tax=Campylobacter pinnipediorum TaxID=1965231 RepID=UPI0009958BAD|nr:hypothetical protein [Campylobacter pinnipediorum]OPA72705.1 hypothetical protein BB381_04810 [Campylobacter pinnipediorum subsp. caledonicus]
MQDIISEILTMSLMAVFIFLFVILKQRVKIKNQAINFDENIDKFRKEFGVLGADFNEICENFIKNGFAKEISKNSKVDEMLEILGTNLFFEFEIPNEIIDEKNLLLCANNLKDDLQMAIYDFKKDKFLVFVSKQEKITKLVKMAGDLGENIIIGV